MKLAEASLKSIHILKYTQPSAHFYYDDTSESVQQSTPHVIQLTYE